jgi:riboflavin synthase
MSRGERGSGVANCPVSTLLILVNLSEGSHVIEVKIVDEAGRSTTESVSIHVVSAERTRSLPWYVIPVVGAGAGFAAAAALAVRGIRHGRKRKAP